MDYRFDSYKINFFILTSLLVNDCFLYSSQQTYGSRRRQRPSEQSLISVLHCPKNDAQCMNFSFKSHTPTVFSSAGSATSFASIDQAMSPEPSQPDAAEVGEITSLYSMVGNKSFTPSKEYHARGLYNKLLHDQSTQILSDFCHAAGIEIDSLHQRVDELQKKFPGAAVNPKSIVCPVKKFFFDHGYGHKSVFIKQEDGWGCPIVFTSCKGVTIYPVFFRLDKKDQQAVLYKELQHLVHQDNFYKHVMYEIIRSCNNSRARLKLQSISTQYDEFVKRRADIKAGISGGDLVLDNLANSSFQSSEASVNYMQELSRMIQQEKKASVIAAWIKDCQGCHESCDARLSDTILAESSDIDSDAELLSDAEEYNVKLQIVNLSF